MRLAAHLPLMLASTTAYDARAPSRSMTLPLATRGTAPAHMLLELPRSSIPFSPLWRMQPAPGEQLAGVDFSMEAVRFTKRRVCGGVNVRASEAALWELLTNFEALPDVIPSIISHHVTRRPDGSAVIEQVSLLSRRLNLRSHMTLEALPSPSSRELVLRRIEGHGFLEFDAIYKLSPKPDGTTYLSYVVTCVPCPIFPLPVVEEKIRREVPKMLAALRDAVEASAV